MNGDMTLERLTEDYPEEKDLQQRSRRKVQRQEGDFYGSVSCVPREEEWMNDGSSQKRSYAQTLSLSVYGKEGTQAKRDGQNGTNEAEGKKDRKGYTVSYDEKGCPSIEFSPKEKERMYRPWKSTLIIKLVGKRIS